jgi:hypothetical protein
MWARSGSPTSSHVDASLLKVDSPDEDRRDRREDSCGDGDNESRGESANVAILTEGRGMPGPREAQLRDGKRKGRHGRDSRGQLP